MNDQIKFADLRVGDTVQFLTMPAVAAPLAGVVTLLNPTVLAYTSEDKTTSLRRASLRLDQRVRDRGTGHSHWVFE